MIFLPPRDDHNGGKKGFHACICLAGWKVFLLALTWGRGAAKLPEALISVINSHVIVGFALLAFPVENHYPSCMTFVVKRLAHEKKA